MKLTREWLNVNRFDEWSYENDIYQDIEYIPRLRTSIEGEGDRIKLAIEHKIRLLQVIVFHGVNTVTIFNYIPEEHT